MSNKIKGKDLGKMIKEALLSEVDIDQFKKLYDREAFKQPMTSTQYSELGDSNDFTQLATVAGSPTELTIDDIQFYDDNLHKITTKVESRLLALKYFPDVDYFKRKKQEAERIQKSNDPDDVKAVELYNSYVSRKNLRVQRDEALDAYLKDNRFFSAETKDDLQDTINDKRAEIAAIKNSEVDEFSYIPHILFAKNSDLKKLTKNSDLSELITQYYLGKLEGGTRNVRRKPRTKKSNIFIDLSVYKEKLDASKVKTPWMKSKAIGDLHQKHIDTISAAFSKYSVKTTDISRLDTEIAILESDIAEKEEADTLAKQEYLRLKKLVGTTGYKTTLRKDPEYRGNTDDKKKKRSEIYSKVNKLIKETEYEETITWLSNENNKSEIQDLKRSATSTLQKFYAEIDKTAKKDQTAFGKRYITAQGDFGEFDEADVSLVKRFFNQETLSQRIVKISEISKNLLELSNNSEQSTDSPSEFLSKIQLMDLITSVAKQYDSGAGAYVFEYFLALIAGGNVEGKATTDAGKMGAADLFYKTDKGRYGSAKFVKEGKSEQAVGGFLDLYRKAKASNNLNSDGFLEVEYAITVKKSDFIGTEMAPQDISESNEQEEQDREDNPGSSFVASRGVTSDPSKMIAIVVWTPMIKYKPSEEGDIFLINDQTAVLTKDKKHLKLNISSMGSPAGTIYITRHRTETFKEMLVETIQDQKIDTQKAFDALQKYMKHLKEAETNARIYTTQKPNEDKPVSETPANKTFESLEKAESSFEELISNIGYGHSVMDTDSDDSSQTSLFPQRKTVQKESKITSNLLKKLIKETLKK